MRILMINKFLYPNGGSETYIFKLGEALEQHGHEVQYFGMEHEGRCVGNRINAYTSDMDFHGGSKLSKLTYPIKTIYSKEARVQLRKVLDDFKPDICHLNNFNYQLTPSIILEIVKWRKETVRDCKIVFTAHDYQLVCPNHMLNNPNIHQNCEKCLGGHFVNCMKGKCIHGSTAKSAIGMMEAEFWKWKGTYKYRGVVIYTWGNVSGISDDRKYMVIKPSGVDYDGMSAEDMVVVDIESGETVEGKWKPSSDTKTHLALYKKYSQIKGIVHTHSTNAVAFAQAGMKIPALGTTHADYFYGDIPCTRELSKEEVMEAYELNTGKVIIETIEKMNYDPMAIPGIVVKNHGPFAWGSSPANAVYNAVVMENVAEMDIKTLLLNSQAEMKQYVLDKHYMRKHGPNAYYGQK